MTRVLAHRGPDDEGIFIDGPLGLGHRRLAINDLSPTGRQPMSNKSGSHWISYNGEFYNHRRLGATLFSLAILASCVIPLLFQWLASYFFSDYPVNTALLIVILAAASFEVANVFPMGLTAFGQLGLLLRIRLVTGILVVGSTLVLVGHTTNLLPFGLVFLAGRILTFTSAFVAARVCSRNQQGVPPPATGVPLG